MSLQILQGWATLALAITGPPSLAWALSKCALWTGKFDV